MRYLIESLEKKNEYTYKLEQLRDQLMEELRSGKKGDEDHENDKGFKGKYECLKEDSIYFDLFIKEMLKF